jgi:transposase
MRYELTEHEWTAIKPMLPNKPRGVPRVNDRRVLNGIFWVLRSGAPWRDLPDEPSVTKLLIGYTAGRRYRAVSATIRARCTKQKGPT